MAKKTRVIVIYGGKSAEHDISRRSAAFVLKNLNRDKYDVQAIAIDQAGHWLPQNAQDLLAKIDREVPIETGARQELVALPTDPASGLLALSGAHESEVDSTVVFPVLHGTYGEDGTMQGLLEMAEVAYVGSDHLGSSMGMDKDVAKRLVAGADVPVVPWVTVRAHDFSTNAQECVTRASGLGFPAFVKPANLGSSVGITKVERPEDMLKALALAFSYDVKVLVEKGLNVREIECAVLGGDDPQVSMPGEVEAHSGFYSYEAKYVDANAASIKVPADLSPEKAEEARKIARRIFIALELYGLARVDLFLDRDDNKFYFNEVNTLPGFTEISQYPMLWKASGLEASELLDRLVALGMERHRRKKSLRRSR